MYLLQMLRMCDGLYSFRNGQLILDCFTINFRIDEDVIRAVFGV